MVLPPISNFPHNAFRYNHVDQAICDETRKPCLLLGQRRHACSYTVDAGMKVLERMEIGLRLSFISPPMIKSPLDEIHKNSRKGEPDPLVKGVEERSTERKIWCHNRKFRIHLAETEKLQFTKRIDIFIWNCIIFNFLFNIVNNRNLSAIIGTFSARKAPKKLHPFKFYVCLHTGLLWC